MRRLDLLPDCGSCAALCCVATSFEASEDFACAKPSGERCAHLTPEDRCSIHGQREVLGFRGCVAFDCYGAGQRATRALGDDAGRQFHALCDLHELLYLVTEAIKLCPTERVELRARLREQAAELDAAAASVASPSPDFAAPDPATHGRRVRRLLREVGAALGGLRSRGDGVATSQ